jgi:hypothetical protein
MTTAKSNLVIACKTFFIANCGEASQWYMSLVQGLFESMCPTD